MLNKKTSLILSISLILVACMKEVDLSSRLYAGGETTSFSATSNAFSFPAPNLSPENLHKHLEGDLQFEAIYVKAPALINAGLGPVFNTTSCISCHPKDGRPAFPESINKRSGLLMRVSLEGEDEYGGPLPVPGFGLQIQNHAVYGYQPEAAYSLEYQYFHEKLDDGTEVELRKPIITLTNTHIPLPPGTLMSPRMGTPMFGLGLLEYIPEEYILRNADEHDEDGDGISGRPNYVYDSFLDKVVLGRFGWKANVGTIETQTATAFIEDMGITSPVFKNDNEEPEITQEVLDQVSFYSRTLAVPAPRDQDNKIVKKGAALFHKIGCASCHVPEQKTGEGPIAELSNQVIYPYTDMLLHDMGEGLADNRPDYLATGREWKTRPLWGIGLTSRVNGHTHFLHDGRARNITEAILWHGGEGENAKKAFKALSKKDREALLTFINSL